MHKRSVLFMGSIVIDHVMYVDKLPEVGQSIMTDNFHRFPGGKGSNQAIAAAKFGADATFFGRIGNESGSEEMMSLLEQAGVNMSSMLITPSSTVGMCVILVEKSGKNMIVFNPAATLLLTPEDVQENAFVFTEDGLLALTMEFQRETVFETIRIAHAKGMEILLDPLPISADEFPADIPAKVDIIKPNESEATALTGVQVVDRKSAEQAADRLLEIGFQKGIISLGEQGILVYNNKNKTFIEPFQVEAVDSTAAGDILIGAFLGYYAKGEPFMEALKKANIVAAISTTRMGAQTSIPSMEEIENNI